MTKNGILLFVLMLAFSCKNDNSSQVIQETEDIAYASFGDEIKAEGALSAADMSEKYLALKEGDTINTKVTASINEVCSKKGCWMKLDLGNGEEMMVMLVG